MIKEKLSTREIEVMAEDRANSGEEKKAVPRPKMPESPNSGDSVDAPPNSKPRIPKLDDFTTKTTNQAESPANGGNKGRSCKGCLYYSSQLKSDSRNPLCIGLSRSLPAGISPISPHFSILISIRLFRCFLCC